MSSRMLKKIAREQRAQQPNPPRPEEGLRRQAQQMPSVGHGRGSAGEGRGPSSAGRGGSRGVQTPHSLRVSTGGTGPSAAPTGPERDRPQGVSPTARHIVRPTGGPVINEGAHQAREESRKRKRGPDAPRDKGKGKALAVDEEANETSSDEEAEFFKLDTPGDAQFIRHDGRLPSVIAGPSKNMAKKVYQSLQFSRDHTYLWSLPLDDHEEEMYRTLVGPIVQGVAHVFQRARVYHSRKMHYKRRLQEAGSSVRLKKMLEVEVTKKRSLEDELKRVQGKLKEDEAQVNQQGVELSDARSRIMELERLLVAAQNRETQAHREGREEGQKKAEEAMEARIHERIQPAVREAFERFLVSKAFEEVATLKTFKNANESFDLAVTQLRHLGAISSEDSFEGLIGLELNGQCQLEDDQDEEEEAAVEEEFAFTIPYMRDLIASGATSAPVAPRMSSDPTPVEEAPESQAPLPPVLVIPPPPVVEDAGNVAEEGLEIPAVHDPIDIEESS